MPTIKFENTGQAFEARSGVSVLECAVEHNLPVEHACGGNCACTTCQVWVVEGMENLSPMTEDERSLLEANDKLDPQSRLSCQCRIKSGSVAIRYPT